MREFKPRRVQHSVTKEQARTAVAAWINLGTVSKEAQIGPGTHASQTVCRSLGFTEEGTLHAWHRIGDDNRDILLFARAASPILPSTVTGEQATAIDHRPRRRGRQSDSCDI